MLLQEDEKQSAVKALLEEWGRLAMCRAPTSPALLGANGAQRKRHEAYLLS